MKIINKTMVVTAMVMTAGSFLIQQTRSFTPMMATSTMRKAMLSSSSMTTTNTSPHSRLVLPSHPFTGSSSQSVRSTTSKSRMFASSTSADTEDSAAAEASSAATSASEEGGLEDVSTMRAGALKKELESYGISTASFVEKSQLVEAVVDARSKGLKPKKETPTATTTTTSTASTTAKKKKKRRSDNEFDSSDSDPTAKTATTDEGDDGREEKDTRPREERLAEQLEVCKAMKVGELKKELEDIGISTKSFFEKTDFVKALAEARVDGVKQKKSRRSSSVDEEGYAEYTDVEVLTDDASGPRQRTSSDNQQRPSGGSPFAGGSPFGGAGNMGGMGGIADMLKNMGMGGGAPGGAGAAAGNPFGGMGGMGGTGDMMGKAQELMKNPKVMELVMKAQGNPKIMSAMQECMSNPAAFAKYQNDPEVSELIDELKKYV